MGYTLGYHEASTGVHAYIHTGRDRKEKKKERQPTAVVVSCCVESARQPKKYGRFPPSLLIRLECFFFPKIKNKKPTPPPAGYNHLLSPSFPLNRERERRKKNKIKEKEKKRNNTHTLYLIHLALPRCGCYYRDDDYISHVCVCVCVLPK